MWDLKEGAQVAGWDFGRDTGKDNSVNMPGGTAGAVQQQQHINRGHGTTSIFEVTSSALQLDCRPTVKINLQIYHWCVSLLLIQEKV